MRRIQALAFSFVAAVLATAPSAHAAGQAALIKEYTTKNHLKTRTVKLKLPGRALTRTFVPVLPETYPDFIEKFSEKNDTIYLRHSADLEHPTVNFAPGRGFNHAGIYAGIGAKRVVNPDAYQWVGNPITAPGRFLTLNLDQPMLKYLDNHWQTTVQGATNNKSGCMWWLVHAEAAKDLPLAHVLGISRAGATSNLIKKIMHAGNERVGVIGVPVPNLEAFDKLTEDQLMGPPPGGGALEAMRD